MRLNNISFVATAALLLAGCGCGGNQQSTDMNTPTQPGGVGRSTTTTQKQGHHVTVGVVFDSGGRGDKSFNDSAFNGTEMAKKDLDIDVKPIETKNAKDYEQNLSGMADACDLVFAIGNNQKDALTAVAAKYPKVKFAIVDAVVDQPNVRSLVFSEEQGSFLAGYLAGLTTKSGKIGFVGGMQMPLIKKFEVGYEAGAKTANPKVEFLPAKYTDSWDDIDKGKAAADVLFNSGADIVYHASGRCGIGVIKSAKEHGKFAIGVDSDQDDVEKGSVLTSMIKHVDQAVYQTIRDTATDSFTPGTKVYDLKSNGVGLSDMKYTKKLLPKDALAKVNKVAEEIKKGKVKVPSTPEQLTAYLTALTAAPTGATTAKK
ncbi:MAG TPA: BMP family ABC transporter substrate-binding protein [Fimbriimonadaceae bacterium]|nr:BMP family ABC transporter substrate-binding protein [Fimbriimonadaceae bacterium]